MPKRKRRLTTDEIQKVLADLEYEIFDDFDSDCELENEEDDLISAQQNSADSAVYINIIKEFISLLNSDEWYTWLQQDSEHSSRNSIEVLTEFFDDHVISKGLRKRTTFTGLVNSRFFP
ncbi:hypothetical protein TNCV_1025001 [Trichonephila clavipes]|nr:hypothetical protein TNCV_1025001 [Trichonephila clavipes]